MTENDLLKRIESLEIEKSKYEKGDAKLYYAFQRKMTEMANILNKNNLESCDIEDKSSKAFDRIIVLLQKCELISSSASALGAIAKITGNQDKDTGYSIVTPESISDVLTNS